MLGVSLEAIKIRLHRARRKLEVALAARCDFSRDEHGVFVCEPTAVADTSVPSGQRRRAPVYPSIPPDRPERVEASAKPRRCQNTEVRS